MNRPHPQVANSDVILREPGERGDLGQGPRPPPGAPWPEPRRSQRARFCKALDRDVECAALRAAGWVAIELEGVGPSARGRLGDVLDGAIERELGARGAAGPGLTSASDRDALLGDQLFRARRVGAPGIAIVLGPLRAAAGAHGVLEPEDCATLRFLAGATRERPVIVILDERDGDTEGYGDPRPLWDLLSISVPRSAASDTTARPCPPCPSRAAAKAPAEPLEAARPGATFPPVGPVAPAAELDDSSTLAAHLAGASVVDTDERWRAWTLQLVAARGPQPLGALEKLFTESYMPLSNAIAAGLDDPRARNAADEFRAAFSRSYAEAFPTFSATTKRPRMVLDVHETAGRIARLHGARSTRMLLVDAMRWDMARQIQGRLVARLGERAVLTDELLLWSALPTTTMRQLETIARGVDALRSPAEIDADAEPPRGRTAEYVRRLRVGAREVHKLDVIESRLQGARGNVVCATPEIAQAAADAIARHVETLAPKTLLFVFGDHGFAVDKTGTARQGGPSPEEVLVGAFALLIGDVH